MKCENCRCLVTQCEADEAAEITPTSETLCPACATSMETALIISRMYDAHNYGMWEGESPDELLARWSNCEHAEVHPDGSLYVAGPGNGVYLGKEQAAEFVDWMTREGVTLD